MEKLKKFFWLCSGVNQEILQKTPTEHSKYAGMGATVFFTGLFAAISGGYALYFIFNDMPLWGRIFAALIFGSIWGAMIFNLDRYIVSSMKKGGGFWRELKIATPRILLAAVIAFVISKPLELQIFHTSIEYELEIMKQKDIKLQETTLTSRYTSDMANLATQIKTLKGEIAQATSQRDQLDEIARVEADGSGGSNKRGAATIYKIKKADAEKAQQELNQLTSINLPLIQSKQAELDKAAATIEGLKSSIVRGEYDGFDKRLDALGNVSKNSPTISMVSIFIMLLFLAIEMSPVLVKLLSPRGPYDDILENDEHVFEVARIEQMTLRNQSSFEKMELAQQTGNYILEQEIEKKKNDTRRFKEAEAEISQEIINKWKREELERVHSGRLSGI
jgi:hypothetical protein